MFTVVLALTSLPGAVASASGQDQSAASSTPEQAGDAWHAGAFVDAAYAKDFNSPANHLFRSRGTTPRVDELDLNMAAAYLRKAATSASRWGLEATAQAGQDSKTFGFSATAPNVAGADWLVHLGPTNVSYLSPLGEGLTLQGGIFSSLIGYDSLYAKDNFNYTRPWGADFTPYLMLGVNAAYPIRRDLTATAFVVNGYWHLAHANDVPSVGGQMAYQATDRLSLKQTVLYGPHQSDTALTFWRFLSDTIVERKTSVLTTAAELQIGTENVDAPGTPRAWWSSAQLPLHVTIRPQLAITVRPEVCHDSDGRWTGFAQTVTAVTSTLEYRARFRQTQTMFRVEHRFDHSTGPGGGFFTDGDGSPESVGLTAGQHLLLVSVIFTVDGTFGSRH